MRCIRSFSASSRQVWILRTVNENFTERSLSMSSPSTITTLRIHDQHTRSARTNCETYHKPQTLKMAKRSGHHSWNAGNGFQKQNALIKKALTVNLIQPLKHKLTCSHCLSSSMYPAFLSSSKDKPGGASSGCLYLTTKSNIFRESLTRPCAILSPIVLVSR